MVWFSVDVVWDVSGFGVSHVLPIGQVEGDIEEVYSFLVGLDCNFQAIATENATQIFFDELCLPW